MTLHVDLLEAIWFLVNAAGLLFTFGALADARRSLVTAQADNLEDRQEAREFTAAGNVRNEILRLVVLLLLISVVVPGLSIDRPINLSPPVVALMLVPVVLLIQTLLDVRGRLRLDAMLLEVVRSERTTLALESSIQENIELTKEAATQAKAAYHEANNVNVKIATLTEKLAQKEDKA